jgi:hypothetical protein
MPASLTTIVGYFLGTAFCGVGLAGLAQPIAQYKTYGLPLAQQVASAATTDVQQMAVAGLSPYVYSKSARDVALGVTFLVLQYQGNEPAITTLLATTSLIGVLDGAIVFLHGGQLKHKAWEHWGGTVLVVAYFISRLTSKGI